MSNSIVLNPPYPVNFIYLGRANCEFVVYPRADGDNVKVFVFHNLNYIYLSLFFLGGGGNYYCINLHGAFCATWHEEDR